MTTWNNQSKSSTSWGDQNQTKAGLGWLYNQLGITYNGAVDPVSGDEVFYNGIGVVTTWGNQSRSSTSWANQSKS